MSTVVEFGMRARREYLDRVVEHVHARMMAKLVEVYEGLLASVKAEAVGERLKKYEVAEPSPETERSVRHSILFDALKQEKESADQLLLCGFNFWLRGGHVYFILYGRRDISEAVFPLPDFVEPYEYYNNTDRPEDVSEGEWEERARNWGEIVDDTCRHLDTKLTHKVFELHHVYITRLELALRDKLERAQVGQGGEEARA